MTKQKNQDEEELKQDEILDMENILEEDIKEAEKSEAELEADVKDLGKISDEVAKLKDALARSQADYQNLIRRVERDRSDMGNYLTGNIIIKIIPFVDNLERIISATPECEQKSSLFEGTKSMYLGIIKTLECFGVKSFESIGKEVDANFHDVMTQLPGEEGKIIQEFEKGYLIGDKVLRHAKVVVGNGNYTQ